MRWEGPQDEQGIFSGELPLAGRVAESILTGSCAAVAAYLLLAARWVPGATAAGAVFALLALGLPVCRALAAQFPRSKVFECAADFWMVPTLVFSHTFFGPVVDAVNPRLLDGYLARADLMLFGGVPSQFTQGFLPPLAMDVLMVCYYSYFLWSFALGITLCKKKKSAFAEYTLGMAIFFVLNFAFYAAVPAVGPRFFMSSAYAAPLQGGPITPLLDGLMRVTAFNRDCFPSGHTGFTLVVLLFAYRHARRFFWVMLPVALGLISATVLGRFHYGIDLICAVPFVALAVSTATAVARERTSLEKRPVSSLRKWVEVWASSR